MQAAFHVPEFLALPLVDLSASRRIFFPHVVRGMGSNCLANVNKLQFGRHLIQCFDAMEQIPRGSVNACLEGMITEVLIDGANLFR